MKKKSNITRKDFIRAFHQAGLTYEQANQAYEAMNGTIASAIQEGVRVSFGSVCSLNPYWKQPKEVVMHFKREGANVVKTTKTFWLGKRVAYRVNVFKAFIETHQLHWF